MLANGRHTLNVFQSLFEENNASEPPDLLPQTLADKNSTPETWNVPITNDASNGIQWSSSSRLFVSPPKVTYSKKQKIMAPPSQPSNLPATMQSHKVKLEITPAVQDLINKLKYFQLYNGHIYSAKIGPNTPTQVKNFEGQLEICG